MKKRILAVIMCICIILGNVKLSAFAYTSQPEVNYKINGDTGVGNTYEIDINVNNINDLYGASMDFAYDNNIIEILEVSKGNIFDNTNAKEIVNKKNEEMVNIAVLLTGSTTTIEEGSGTLIKLKVKSLKEGKINLKTISDNTKLDKNNQNIRIKLSHSNGGSITYNQLNDFIITQNDKKLDVFSKFTINTVRETSTYVSGYGESGATVRAYVNGKQIGSSVKCSTNTGYYKITIPKQVGGTTIVIKMSKTGYETEEKSKTVLKVFSKFTINTVKTTSTYVSGYGEKGATVRAYIDGNQVGSSVKSSSNTGYYKITIPKQKAGKVITIKMSKTGFASEEKETKVLNIFGKFTINTVKTTSTYVSGYGEKGATVKAYVNGKQIGSSVKCSTSTGYYKITIPKQSGGKTIVIKMSKTGYVSEEKETKVLKVFSKFTINTVKTISTYVSGYGEKGATVKAYVNGKQIGKTIKSSSNTGYYKITIPKQKKGIKIEIKMSKSGYASSSKTTTVK